MKSPNILLSYLIGLILPVVLFGGLFLTIYISQPLPRFLTVIAILCLSGAILFGEIIHIHRKLNRFEEEENE